MEVIGLVVAAVVVAVLAYVFIQLIRQGFPGDVAPADGAGDGPTGDRYPPGSRPAGPGAERMTDAPPIETTSPHVEVPRAVDHVGEIRGVLGSEAKVFLDYDGTLTPIVDDPSQATIGSRERDVLGKLADRVAVAIVSGRGMKDVQQLVAVDGLTYAGSHGFEIEHPDGMTFEHPEAHRLATELDAAERRLEDHADDLGGVFIERKPFAIALHTRRAKSDQIRDRAADLAERVAAEFDALSVRGGKEIHEIRPALDWDKGRAVEHLLGRFPGDPRPLYIGDDETDEDAFRMVRRLGGVGILVGASNETAASYSLADPDETMEFLTRLAAAFD